MSCLGEVSIPSLKVTLRGLSPFKPLAPKFAGERWPKRGLLNLIYRPKSTLYYIREVIHEQEEHRSADKDQWCDIRSYHGIDTD